MSWRDGIGVAVLIGLAILAVTVVPAWASMFALVLLIVFGVPIVERLTRR